MIEPTGDPPDRLTAALAEAERADRSWLADGAEPVTIAYTEQVDDGKTLSIGPEIEKVLGYTQTEWMADPFIWLKLMHPEDRDRVVGACDLSNATGEPFRAEYRMIARDGRVVWFRDESLLLTGSHGQGLCWQGLMTVVRIVAPASDGKGWARDPRPR
jgi:PAS domain S-box-containing protein